MGTVESRTHAVHAPHCDGWTINEITEPYTEWRLCRLDGRVVATVDACGYVELPVGAVRGEALAELLQRAGLLSDEQLSVAPWMLPVKEVDDGTEEE